METVTYRLTGKTRKALRTEILFCLADARVRGKELISLFFKFNDKHETVARILRSEKKEGRIELFVSSNEFFRDEGTETSYLKNKYPETNEMSEKEPFFLIRINLR